MKNTRIACLILPLLFAFCEAQSSTTLHGTFIDAENGQPIPDVLVRADAEKIAQVYPNRDFEHATATDANGTFSLTIPNDPQTYYAFSLMAIHPKYQAKRLRHEMSPGKSRYNLGEIALKRTLTLKGTCFWRRESRWTYCESKDARENRQISSVPPHRLNTQ